MSVDIHARNAEDHCVGVDFFRKTAEGSQEQVSVGGAIGHLLRPELAVVCTPVGRGPHFVIP